MALTPAQRAELIERFTRERQDASGVKRWWRGQQLRRLSTTASDATVISDDLTRRGVSGHGGGRVLPARSPGVIIEGSTRQMPGLWPWTIGGDSPIIGAPLGHHLIHQRPVHFDSLDWANAGHISAPVVIILASNGVGKSTLAARLMTYAIATGRCVIAAADIKPDHAERLVRMGGQHIKCNADIINPLAPGAIGRAALRLEGQAQEDLRANMLQSQIINMKTLIRLQRGNEPIGDVEGAILAEAIRELNSRPTQADDIDHELKHLDELLGAPTEAMLYKAVARSADDYHAAAHRLIGSVRAMVSPESIFGRMFSGQTTTPLDLDAVGIDIDVSRVPEGDKDARSAAIALGWTESYAAVTAAHALSDAGKTRPRVFDLYLEELWQVLGAGDIVLDILNRESRTNRTKGTTITAMTHSVSDFAGSVDAAQADTAQAIFEKCQARFYGRVGTKERQRLLDYENFTDAEVTMFTSWGRAHGLHSSDPGREKRKAPGVGHFILKLSEDDGAGIPFKVHVPAEQERLHRTSARLEAVSRETS